MRNALIAEILRMIEPDTGNRFAPRSIQTKGAAAHRQWERTVRALAYRVGGPRARARFIKACGIEVADG